MRCLVEGCKNSEGNCTAGIDFHMPMKTTRTDVEDAWRKFCGNLSDYVMPVVCSRHFQTSDFRGRNMFGKLLLRRNVVPSIKPDQEEQYVMFENEGELDFQLESLEEGMDLPENVLLVNEEGEEYILSDNVGQDGETPTLILAGESEGEELLLNEEELYVLEETSEDIPPLMTFDGRLVTYMDDSEDREVSLVRETLAMETAPESPPTEFHLLVDVERLDCSHKKEHETNLKIIKQLEIEMRDLTADIDVLASKSRRMRSEIGRVQKTFGCMFTSSQMDRIQGVVKKPWQKKDFHRALSFKLLGPKAYKFLNETYKFPLPSLNYVNMYEKERKGDIMLVYDEVKAFKAMMRNKKSQDV